MRDEWSQRVGRSRWLVWKHGTRSDDEERLLRELVWELEREKAEAAGA
jgi:hypothetical protein